MATLNIVLVEPEIPQNTGNIARTCAATGTRLHIIEPMGFTPDDKKLKRAGLDYWHLLDITYYKNLDDFFKKIRTANIVFSPPRRKTAMLMLNIATMFISFRQGNKGLARGASFNHPSECVRIPMINDSAARSLNLSNSVAIAVYEVLRQWDYPNLLCAGKLTKFDWENAE